ncbi:MAG TPA: hypothetical protein VEW74_06475 [Candidatus Nitrosotalea sp.]|nr:hypothetical protein [Candidatus Nitrosotalea sp.]
MFLAGVAAASIPPWLIAKPGAVVFTSTGEEDSPTTPVCSTPASYRSYVNENGATGCIERPAGVKVIIDAIVPANGSFGAIAKIHAQSGAFHGYTALTELLPPIPAGVEVTLAPAANEALTISQDRRAELGSGIDLGAKAPAVTVRFDPGSEERDLLVRVTGGKNLGKSGWVFARQASLGGLPVNVLKL